MVLGSNFAGLGSAKKIREYADNSVDITKPLVLCIGDMGANQALYIRSNTWYGGEDAVLKMGRVPFMLKMQYKTLFLSRGGKVPN